MGKIRIAICQMSVCESKDKNNEKMEQMITEAAEHGAELVVLPEMFNTVYSEKYFKENAEQIHAENMEASGKTTKLLSGTSKRNGIYVVGGSIPEADDDGLYNTCCVFDKMGHVIAKHRKVHLFEIEAGSGMSFKESKCFNGGDRITLFDTQWGRMGVIICYDVRFPEMARIMAMKGAKVIFVPAAFNMITGPAHWKLLLKTRAADNQLYMVGACPARDESKKYVAYGHSMVTDPWGEVTAELDEKEGILICELDLGYLDEVRRKLPLLKNMRSDLYEVKVKSKE